MASASGKLTAVKCATCFPGDKDWSCKLKAEGPGHRTFSSNFQWQCPASWPTLNYNHLTAVRKKYVWGHRHFIVESLIELDALPQHPNKAWGAPPSKHNSTPPPSQSFSPTPHWHLHPVKAWGALAWARNQPGQGWLPRWMGEPRLSARLPGLII